ncbi:hypothetical protein CK203_057036 [Vitis vinifera]|uniref:Retrotransposon gag domain-containing protein n=1 Tax=Vitis vinifera TaxID=29760 RepID=A0A438GN49_VITVI|nr:hypothetical protein CK203_057036 [Vitis vinifera]
MSFDQHGNTVVLDMMRSMSYLPDMGLGRRQHGPSEFMAMPDHDVPFGLGFIPTEANYRYMARLCKEKLRAWLTHTPFDYPVHLYTMSLADYFMRASELKTHSDGNIGEFNNAQEAELQIRPELASPFDLFEVSIIEVAKEVDTPPVLEFSEDIIVFDDLFDGHVSLVGEVFDFVDPPLSFDVLSGFVSRFDDHDSDDDSSSAFDSNSIDPRDSLAIGDVKIVGFVITTKTFAHQSNPRMRESCIFFMAKLLEAQIHEETKLWSLIVLCLSHSKYARKEQWRRGKQSKEKQGTTAAVFLRTFGALPEVHFLHAIYYFKAQEVKNPTLQTIQTTSEDVFPEDERLIFWFLGVKEARITLNGQYMVSSNLCMPYWIRKQEGRLVRIENPQDTELDICVNIMDPPQEDQNSQHGQGDDYKAHIVPLLPNFHGMESENPYSHIKEFEEVCNTFREGGASIDLMRLKLFPFTLKDKAKIWLNSTNGLKRQISNFSAKENEKFHECWERYMEAINACPHHGFDTWLLVSYFYDGMSSSMKQILETMCGGDFMSKNPEEAMEFLSYVSEVSRGWDEPNSREKGKVSLSTNPKSKGWNVHVK